MSLFAPEGHRMVAGGKSRSDAPTGKDGVKDSHAGGMGEGSVHMEIDRLPSLRTPPAPLPGCHLFITRIRWGRRQGSSATGYHPMPLRGKEQIVTPLPEHLAFYATAK
ncbi:MAG: hypothetical protein QM755_02535 [Luteolibacter sp.]